MKKLVSIIFLWLLSIGAIYAQTTQIQPSSLVIVQQQEKINELEVKNKEIEANFKELSTHINCLEYVVEKQNNLISQEQSVIENGLSVSNWLLGMFSLLVALGGIFLGWYISRKEKSMEGLLENVTDKQEEITALKKDIETTAKSMRNLDKEMKNNVDGLFQRLRRNDTISLLKRLENIPEDITNLSDLLLSRDLEHEDFDMLLKAYMVLMEDSSNATTIVRFNFTRQHLYLLLFFQHFCGRSIQTIELKDEIVEFFPQALQCAFKLDIKNSLLSIIETLNGPTIDDGNETILVEYIKALNMSQHKDYKEPYSLIVGKCNNTIDLQSVWNKLVEQKVIIESFGALLCEKYRNDTRFTQKVKMQIATLLQNKKNGDLGNHRKINN